MVMKDDHHGIRISDHSFRDSVIDVQTRIPGLLHLAVLWI